MKHSDFTKKQYKKLSSAFRGGNIALMSCYFTNLTLRYGGQFASDLALFIEQTEEWKRSRRVYSGFRSDSYSWFYVTSIARRPHALFTLLKKIRKQEEAPKAGAESSSDFVCIECVHCGSVDEKEILNTIHGLVCRDCLGV